MQLSQSQDQLAETEQELAQLDEKEQELAQETSKPQQRRDEIAAETKALMAERSASQNRLRQLHHKRAC